MAGKRKASAVAEADDGHAAKKPRMEGPADATRSIPPTQEPASLSIRGDQPGDKQPVVPKTLKKAKKPAKPVMSYTGLGPKAPPAKIRKLEPPKPTGVNDGDKTSICVTRKTNLATYLRRCRQLFDDGHTSIHLYALGAAIPHLTLLATSLPQILPGGVLRQDVTTSTVTCVDEIEPEDEDVDMSMRTRGKAAMQIVLWLREEGSSDTKKVQGKGVKMKGKRTVMSSKQRGNGRDKGEPSAKPKQVPEAEMDIT